MLIDRSHLSWALFFGISLIAGTVSYVAYAWDNPHGPSGGSAMGLLFGIIGTLMMLFAGLLAARKPLRIRRIGSAQFWLKGHLWLGTLCIPFILFHSGFGWGGLLEQLMWYSLAVVAVSGFFGLAVHQFLPRLLWNQTPLETFEAQTPYQCDRMTLISDLRISALCKAPLVVPPGHLQEHYAKLISGFYSIVNGPGKRGELNARKLVLLQQVAPPDVRDFCWAMAKHAKSEVKDFEFEGDFPELLEKTYAGLKASTVGSSAHTPPKVDPHAATPGKQTNAGAAELKVPVMSGVDRTISKPEAARKHKDATPQQQTEPGTPSPLVDATAPAALNPQANLAPAETPKLSPIEMMRKKAAEKAMANAMAAPDVASSVPAMTPETPTPESSPQAPAADVPKISPIEMMRKKAAEKAKASAESTPTETSVVPATKAETPAPDLSPPEMMRKKAAEKAKAPEPAAVAPNVEGKVESPAKKSPLDMLKKNNPDANSAAPPPAKALTPIAATVKPETAAPAQNKAVEPTILEKQLLREVYLDHVRPFLTDNRSRRSVRWSPLASAVEARRLFHEKESMLPAALHPILNELSEFCEIRRQIEHQRQILRWMHWWLLVHVPAAAVLLVFLVAHVVMALRVIPYNGWF